MATEEGKSHNVLSHPSKMPAMTEYEVESVATPPKSLTTTVVERRHKYESPAEALRRREARRAVKSSPHVTPDGVVFPTSVDELYFDSELERKIESPDYRDRGLRKLKTKSWESVERWKQENEFLYAMIEDEAQWLRSLFPEEPVAAEYFFQSLEDGVVLCKLAQLCQNFAENLARKEKVKVTEFLIKIHPRLRCRGPMGQFMRRENVELFLKWCRAHRIPEPILFESNDVVEQSEEEGLREGAREIVLCLMEVARLGVKFGVRPPQLIILEHEIEQEEKMDSMLVDGSTSPLSVDSGVDTEQDLINEEVKDLVRSDCEANRNQLRKYSHLTKSELHERVQKLIEEYHIQKFTRLREGKYLIMGKVMFVRMLSGHVIVRVGGGWDGLEHYLMTHVGVTASSATVERSKSPSAGNQSSSNFSPSNATQAELRRLSFATSSSVIHLVGSEQVPVNLGLSSSSDSSRSSSPLSSGKDRFDQAEIRRKNDERKISHAIMKVQAETYSKLIKAASLADLSNPDALANVRLRAFRKYSAFEPRVMHHTGRVAECNSPGRISNFGPSLERPTSALHQNPKTPDKFKDKNIVAERKLATALDPKLGTSAKTLSLTKTRKSSSNAGKTTKAVKTETKERMAAGGEGKNSGVTANEKGVLKSRSASVKFVGLVSSDSAGRLPTHAPTDPASATVGPEAVNGYEQGNSTTASKRTLKQCEVGGENKTSTVQSLRKLGPASKQRSNATPQGRAATLGRQQKDASPAQIGAPEPRRPASVASFKGLTWKPAGQPRLKETTQRTVTNGKSLAEKDSIASDASSFKVGLTSRIAGTKKKSASTSDLSSKSAATALGTRTKSKTSANQGSSSLSKTTTYTQKKPAANGEVEVKGALTTKADKPSKGQPKKGELVDNTCVKGLSRESEVDKSTEILVQERSEESL